jgi:Ser/Thr protein kinase RdoA (MazF antagonist)
MKMHADEIEITDGLIRGLLIDFGSFSRMRGATSSAVYLVHAGKYRYVLRILNNDAWFAREPDLAPHEAAAITEAQQTGVAAPKLIAFAPRALLMTYLPGAVELRPANFSEWLHDLARTLASIHSHKSDSFPWRFRTWLDRNKLTVPRWVANPSAWQRAIEIVREPAPQYCPVFIHRDYHPANVLWQEGRISGVVDWINACIGPAGIDVAHCRGNLASMYGPDAADEFLRMYMGEDDSFEYQPYWDLETLLDCLSEPCYYPPWQEFGLGEISVEELRHRAESYLERILERV